MSLSRMIGVLTVILFLLACGKKKEMEETPQGRAPARKKTETVTEKKAQTPQMTKTPPQKAL